MLKYLRRKIFLILGNLEYYFNLRNLSRFTPEKLNRNETYKYFLFHFYKYLPFELVKHRLYFSKEKRGFGEDAFHSMWFYLFKLYKPINILEIGVYRGQTLTLFTVLSKLNKVDSNIFGLTPLDDSGDSVSDYIKINYEMDIIENFHYFGFENPKIINTRSESSEGTKFIKSRNWDLVYVDGSHEYDDVKFDVNRVIKNLNHNGLLVIDDSSLFTDFNNVDFEKFRVKAFKGHEGPSKIFNELLENNSLRFIIGVGHNNVFVKI